MGWRERAILLGMTATQAVSAQAVSAQAVSAQTVSLPLIERLRAAYPAIVEHWERDCNTGKVSLTYSPRDGELGDRVLGICWEPPSADGSRAGSSLGRLPLDADPEFRVGCDRTAPSRCASVLDRWQVAEPQAAIEGLQACASLQGSLGFRERDGGTEIVCQYFARRYWDEDGDFQIDREAPVSVGRTLGRIAAD